MRVAAVQNPVEAPYQLPSPPEKAAPALLVAGEDELAVPSPARILQAKLELDYGAAALEENRWPPGLALLFWGGVSGLIWAGMIRLVWMVVVHHH